MTHIKLKLILFCRDPRFIREFKAKYCMEVFVEHVPTKKKFVFLKTTSLTFSDFICFCQEEAVAPKRPGQVWIPLSRIGNSLTTSLLLRLLLSHYSKFNQITLRYTARNLQVNLTRTIFIIVASWLMGPNCLIHPSLSWSTWVNGITWGVANHKCPHNIELHVVSYICRDHPHLPLVDRASLKCPLSGRPSF